MTVRTAGAAGGMPIASRILTHKTVSVACRTSHVRYTYLSLMKPPNGPPSPIPNYAFTIRLGERECSAIHTLSNKAATPWVRPLDCRTKQSEKGLLSFQASLQTYPHAIHIASNDPAPFHQLTVSKFWPSQLTTRLLTLRLHPSLRPTMAFS